MTAGLNLKSSIWRIDYEADNSVGGAVTTGTVVYENVFTRLQANMEEQLLLQQGLETQRTFRVVVVPGTMDIRERDELEVTQPTDHIYYNKRFRIIGVTYSNFTPRDPRNYLMLTLDRSVRTHDRQ